MVVTYVFELFTGIYAEKIESGHYSVFTSDGSIKAYININQCTNFRRLARLIRNIARQIADFQVDTDTNMNKGGHGNEEQ